MKRFQIKNISQIPLEGTHDLPDSRQTLATKDDLVTDNIDAMTKGILKPGQYWDWHTHEEYDELGIVLQGKGIFYWEDEKVEYKKEDVIIIPAKSRHKFEAIGDEVNEFYFVRIKV
jgi:quercetin dioxygenase-like cupin family protein